MMYWHAGVCDMSMLCAKGGTGQHPAGRDRKGHTARVARSPHVVVGTVVQMLTNSVLHLPYQDCLTKERLVPCKLFS